MSRGEDKFVRLFFGNINNQDAKVSGDFTEYNSEEEIVEFINLGISMLPELESRLAERNKIVMAKEQEIKKIQDEIKNLKYYYV